MLSKLKLLIFGAAGVVVDLIHETSVNKTTKPDLLSVFRRMLKFRIIQGSSNFCELDFTGSSLSICNT